MIIEQLFILIINLIEGLLKALFELVKLLITALPKNKKGYHAEFAWAGSLLSGRQKGFCLTGRKNLSVKDSYRGALVSGGTGFGKSTVVLLPSIYSMKGSFVIHDPSGELFSKSAGYLKQKGYDIKILNFANPENSSGYNPLARAKNSSDVQKVASMLVDNALGGKSKDPFWNIQATSLLTMLISILKTQGAEYQNLYNVRQLLNRLGGSPESIDALFSKHANEELFAEYKSFIAYDEKVVSGIIATCKAALQVFHDESVAKVTSFDNLDFQDFRSKPTALYIQNSVADQKYYSILTSILFEQFFSFILSRFPKENELDIFLLIDEASSLNLPTLPLAVANVRKHQSGIMLLVQDFSQLIHLYGKYEADGIKSNCFAKMYFAGASLETSKELEQTLGQYQYEDENKKTVVRSLMTNDEIRTMKENRALLICGNRAPIMAKLKPYYKQSRYENYGSINPPKISLQVGSDQIPVLPANLNETPHDKEE